jgi:hypothetical protein
MFPGGVCNVAQGLTASYDVLDADRRVNRQIRKILQLLKKY